MSVCWFDSVKVVILTSVIRFVSCLEWKRDLEPMQWEREDGRGKELSVEWVRATAERFKWLFVYEIEYGQYYKLYSGVWKMVEFKIGWVVGVFVGIIFGSQDWFSFDLWILCVKNFFLIEFYFLLRSTFIFEMCEFGL